MADSDTFLYVATYDSLLSAEEDFDAVAAMHASGLIGTYDAALVSRRDGKVHVRKREKPTQHGAWTGIGVGALIGLLFPPSVLGAAALGGVAGGVTGHLWKGMSRGDMKDLGEALDEGEAAVVVIGEAGIKELDSVLSRSQRRMHRFVKADARALRREIEREQLAA